MGARGQDLEVENPMEKASGIQESIDLGPRSRVASGSKGAAGPQNNRTEAQNLIQGGRPTQKGSGHLRVPCDLDPSPHNEVEAPG